MPLQHHPDIRGEMDKSLRPALFKGCAAAPQPQGNFFGPASALEDLGKLKTPGDPAGANRSGPAEIVDDEAARFLEAVLTGGAEAPRTPALRRGFIFDPADPGFSKLLQAFHSQGVTISAEEFSRVFADISNRASARTHQRGLRRLRQLIAELQAKQAKKCVRVRRLTAKGGSVSGESEEE